MRLTYRQVLLKGVLLRMPGAAGVPGVRLGVFASTRPAVVDLVKKNLSIWNINSFGEFFLQIIKKYLREYRAGCERLAAERNRFVGNLSQFAFLTVYPSAANYVLCRVNAPHAPQELMMKLWTGYRILIKDCSHKKGFDGAPFIRLAVRDAADNDALVAALKERLRENHHRRACYRIGNLAHAVRRVGRADGLGGRL